MGWSSPSGCEKRLGGIRISGAKVQPPVINVNDFEALARVHVLFEAIHPFGDGNGRTGRILLNYLAIIIKGEQDEERKRYYSDLEAATADRTVWLSVLEHIIGGDKNLQRTLQEIAGYALSSFSALRLIFWLYGPAGTGKSTFSELLSTILDDMAVTLDTKHLGTTGERERLAA